MKINNLNIVMGNEDVSEGSITYGEYFKNLWKSSIVLYNEERGSIINHLLMTMSDNVLLELMKGTWNIFAIQNNLKLPFPEEATKDLVEKERIEEQIKRPGIIFNKRKRNLENRFYQDVFEDTSKGQVDGSFLSLLYIELKKRKLGNEVSLPYHFCRKILSLDVFTKDCSGSQLFRLLTEIIIKDEENTTLIKDIGLNFIKKVKSENIVKNDIDDTVKSFLIDFKKSWDYSNKKKEQEFLDFLKEYMTFYSDFVNINLKKNDYLKKDFDLNVISWRKKKDCFNNRSYAFFKEENSVFYEENEVRKVSISIVSLINYQRDQYANILKETALIDNLEKIFFEFNQNKIIKVDLLKNQEEGLGVLFEKRKKLKNVNFIELTDHVLKLVLTSNLKRISVVQELEDLMEKTMMKEDISTQKKINTNLLKF